MAVCNNRRIAAFLWKDNRLYDNMIEKIQQKAIKSKKKQNKEILIMNEIEIQFDNHDNRIKHYELLLERDLDELPYVPLPKGYKFVFYKQGDRDIWIDIEKSAKEFVDYTQGLEAWNRYYENHEKMLFNRMVFIENSDGEKVATATAYYDITNRDKSGAGWLHWVAVRKEYQGKGLSKPLILYVLDIMRKLGYTHAKIPTQTTTWLACKVYLDLGFVPLRQNAINSKKGWEIIKALTNHASLYSFAPASTDEIIVEQERKNEIANKDAKKDNSVLVKEEKNYYNKK